MASLHLFVVLMTACVYLSEGVLISRGIGQAIEASSFHDLATIKKTNGNLIIYFHQGELDQATQDVIDSEQKKNTKKAHFFTIVISPTEKQRFNEQFPEIVKFPAILAITTHMKQGEEVKIAEFVKTALKD